MSTALARRRRWRVAGSICGLVAIGAIAWPAYQNHTARIAMTSALFACETARDALAQYEQANGRPPPSLSAADVADQVRDGSRLSLGANGRLTVTNNRGGLVFDPTMDATGHVLWRCHGSAGMPTPQLPSGCLATPAGRR